jgi:hypothetical protein
MAVTEFCGSPASVSQASTRYSECAGTGREFAPDAPWRITGQSMHPINVHHAKHLQYAHTIAATRASMSKPNLNCNPNEAAQGERTKDRRPSGQRQPMFERVSFS